MYFYFWGAVDSGYHHNTFGRRLNNFCYKLLSTLNKGQTTNNKKNWRWILDCSTLCQVKIKLRLLHHNFQFHSLYYFYNMGHPKLQRMQDCVSWWHLPLGIANISEILSHKIHRISSLMLFILTDDPQFVRLRSFLEYYVDDWLVSFKQQDDNIFRNRKKNYSKHVNLSRVWGFFWL